MTSDDLPSAFETDSLSSWVVIDVETAPDPAALKSVHDEAYWERRRAKVKTGTRKPENAETYRAEKIAQEKIDDAKGAALDPLLARVVGVGWQVCNYPKRWDGRQIQLGGAKRVTTVLLEDDAGGRETTEDWERGAIAAAFCVLNQTKVVAGHNINFDLSVLAARAARLDLMLPPWLRNWRRGSSESYCYGGEGVRVVEVAGPLAHRSLDDIAAGLGLPRKPYPDGVTDPSGFESWSRRQRHEYLTHDVTTEAAVGMKFKAI